MYQNYSTMETALPLQVTFCMCQSFLCKVQKPYL